MAGCDGAPNTKLCAACGSAKPFSEFARHRAGRYGLRSQCKVCQNAARKAWYCANRERKIAAVKAWQESNKERNAATKKAWHEANRDAALARGKAWREANKDHHLENVKAWQADNQERIAIARRAWRKENKQRYANTYRSWCEANPELIRAYAAARRAMRLKATPSWANRDAILEYYEDAVRLSAETGYAWHVDHIVPLKSKFVCGLHCEANLRVIPSVENLTKNNRWWPHMALDGPMREETRAPWAHFKATPPFLVALLDTRHGSSGPTTERF